MLSGEPGATGARLLGPVRGDSGFYTHAIVAVCREMDVRYSIVIRQRHLIETIPGDYTRDPRHNPRRVIIDTPVPLVRCSAGTALRSKPAAGIACPA